MNRLIVEATLAGRAQRFVDRPIALAGRPKLPISWFSFSWTPLRDDTQKIVGFFCVAHETTDHMLAQRALEKSEEQFRTFTMASADILYRMNADWTLMRQLDGRGFLIDTAKPRGNWMDNYIPAIEQLRVRAAITDAVKTRNMFDLEHRVLRSDGTIGWTHSRAMPILDAQGEILEWFGAASDITSRMHALDRLRESEKNYHALFAASPVPLMVISSEPSYFTVITVNDAYLAATMTTRGDIIGRKVFDGFTDNPDRPHAEGLGQLRASLQRVLKSGQPDALPRSRYDIVDRDGKFCERWWSSVNAPVVSASGKITAIIRQVTDVTAQYHAELDEQERQQHVSFLLELGDALRPLADAEQIKNTAMAQVAAHFHVQMAFYTEFEADEDQGHIEEAHGNTKKSFPVKLRLSDFGSHVTGEMTAGRTAVYEDVETDARLSDGLAAYRAFNIHSGVGVPLIKDGRLVASFAVNHDAPRKWAKSEVLLLEDVAQRIWLAIERAKANDLAVSYAKQMETLLENSPVGIAYFDRAHRYVRINEHLAHINGATVEAHLGQKIEAMIPDLAAGVIPLLDQVFSTRTAVSQFEATGPTPRAPGKSFSWLVNFFPVLSTDGTVASVGAFVLDITARKHAEEELAATAAWLSDAQNYGGVGSWTFDHKTRAGKVSPNYLQIHGLKADNAVFEFTRVIAAMHADDRAPFIAAVKNGMKTRERSTLEYRVIDESGSQRWIRSVGQMIEDNGAPTSRSSGIAEDVTEEHTIAAELATSEATFRAIFEQAAVGIANVKIDGTIINVNERFCAIVGREASELIGQTFQSITHPDDLAEDLLGMKRLMAGEIQTYTMEKRYIKPDGTDVWATLSVGLVRDSSGAPQQFTSIVEDIAPRKLLETKYAVLNLELESRIAQRTQALHQANAALTQEFAQRERLQAQLVQTQKLEALGHMTAGFAHDFNNTLQAVASGFSMIEKWSKDSRVKQVAQMSLEAAHRGSNLIKQMLSFARQQRLEVRSVDLPKLLATLEPILQRAAPNAMITTYCAPDTPAASTDPTLLEAALINFTVNAHDAMPGGRGHITLKIAACPTTDADYPPELGDKGAVAICVTDNGSGIAPEALAHVMEPFFTTKDVGKGTGLGLASASGFAHQSGGALRISSVVGEGTTVKLYLPTFKQTNADLTPSPLTARAKASGQHILLMDDDPLVRTLTALQLRDLGYTVTEVASAHDAMKHCGDFAKFIGVVSDVTMPECDGPTMIGKMRDFYPALKVVYITGKPHSKLLDNEYVLNKPFTVQALSEAMTHFG